MAETSPTPGTPDAEGSEAGTGATGADALSRALDAAMDVDDLPPPQHDTVPPTPEALARPAEPAAAAAPVPEPGIAATLEVPPLPAGEGSEGEGAGGEWEMLLEKVRAWLGSGELQKLLSSIGGPLRLLAYLIGLVLLLRLYASVVGTIDGIPLIGGLLELVGLIAFVRFSLSNLVRRSDREKVLADWQRRWSEFRGRV
jgi:hypothetical protein